MRLTNARIIIISVLFQFYFTCKRRFRYVQSRNSDSRSMFYIMPNDCFHFSTSIMYIKMHVRTSKLAKKNFRVLYPHAQIQQGRERELGKGRGREKERRGKGKGRRHGGRDGRKEGMGNSNGGNCATALRGG